ncbi:MAG: type II toxin-antitoxin system RelE/ParE family toxin [Clostridia bacterium]|nr:type II toxin-antitoxin system RelE/ParE family toxin [Clostridia bacterium]
MKYSIVCDTEVIDEQFHDLSPFNLKNDVKNINENQLTDIAENIANELVYGPHGKTNVVLYESKVNFKVNYSKIRCADRLKKKGKSDGFRCIVLVDNVIHYGFILHIYPKNETENITKKEENGLKILVETYVKEAGY